MRLSPPALFYNVSQKRKACLVQLGIGFFYAFFQKNALLYTLVDHQQCFEEFGASATDFMAAAALVAGASLMVLGLWKQDGVHMISEFDPIPFLKELKKQGLEYKVLEEAPELDVTSDVSEDDGE